MRERIPVVVAATPAFLLGAAFVLLVVLSDTFRTELVTVWNLMLEGDPAPLRQWMLGFGAWAPIVSALLQIATSLIPPLPSFLLSIANAMLYGPVLGGLLTFVTALIAAAACFGFARVVGRPGIKRIVAEEKLARVDGFMARRGLVAVFLARVIPFINPDIASYVAGVTGIRWVPFLAAMAAGSVPATVFYSIVGAAAVETTPWVIGAVVVSTIIPIILLFVFRRRIPTGTVNGDPEADPSRAGRENGEAGGTGPTKPG